MHHEDHVCKGQTGCPLKLALWLVVTSPMEVELQFKPAQLLAYMLMISSVVDHMYMHKDLWEANFS